MRNPTMRNHLRDNFYSIPAQNQQTMTTKEFRETLLVTDGEIMACGHLWTIVGKRIGPGVYRITLEKYENQSTT